MKKLIFILFFLLFISSACKALNAVSLTPSITQTIITEPAIITPEKTLSPTEIPTVTHKSIPSSNELEASILEMLNNGIEPSTIIQSIQSSMVEIQITLVDFNNDGIDELVIPIRIGIVNLDECESIVLILKHNQEGEYETEYSKSYQLTIDPEVVVINDINNDKRVEVIVQSLFYTSAGVCSINILVLGWQDNQFVNLFDESPPDINCPVEVKLGEKINGYYELLVLGSSSGTWSGGPGRITETKYILENNRYMKLDIRLLPSNIRIHVLQDAQIAFDEQNYELALELWDKAAYDATLENFPSIQLFSQDKPEIYQPAYALYRIYSLYLLLGKEEQAKKILDELKSKYPENSPGGEFIGISHELEKILASSKDPEFVCSIIYEFIAKTYTDEFLFYRWDWGHNNQDIVDFCPLHR